MSLTVSLIAVLIPLLFMREVVGRLFREFAITLAISILISAVVSLTLVPMLCAKMLRRSRNTASAARAQSPVKAERAFNRLVAGYDRMLTWVLDHQTLVLWMAAGTVVLTVVLYMVIPKGFFPLQDTGILQGMTEADPRFRLRHGRAAAGAGRCPASRPGRREPVVVRRRRRHQHHAQQRPLSDQSETQGRARRHLPPHARRAAGSARR